MLHLISLTLALQVVALAYGQKPPFDLGNRTLGVIFNNDTLVNPPGIVLPLNLPVSAPTIGLPPPSLNGTYLVIMVDPDTSRPNVLHWLQTDLKSNLPRGTAPFPFQPFVASSPPITPYARPRPPVGSGFHRYTQLLYAQPANFSVPSEFAQIVNGENRTGFNLEKFLQATGLGKTVAGNYFLTANETGTVANGTTTGSSGTGRAPLATSTTAPFTGGVGSPVVEASIIALALLCGLMSFL